jgi:hypothetical protein
MSKWVKFDSPATPNQGDLKLTKKRVTILSTMLNVIGILVLLVVFVFPQHVEEPVENLTMTPTDTPMMTPTATSSVKIKLDLEFDTADDLKWIQVSTNGETQNPNSQEVLKEGFIRLGEDNPYNAVGVLYGFEPGQFIHFRTRTGERTCGFAGLEIGLPNQSKGIKFDGCADDLYNVTAVFNVNHFGDSLFANLQTVGSVPMFKDVWIDEIMWLNESGDQLYYVVALSDDAAHVMYGSVALSEDWQYDNFGYDAGGWFDENQTPAPYYDIDLIRVGSGTLKDYLAEYIPAYQENKDELDAFLEKPAQPMPELLPLQEEGYENEENGDENESE